MAGYLNINPIQFLSDEDIETQAKTDLIAYQKKIGGALPFPIYPDEVAEKLWGIKIEYPNTLSDEDGSPVLACFIPTEKKIQLNVSLAKNKGRTSFTLAHEVGHVSLHGFLKDFSPEGIKRFCRTEVSFGQNAEEQARQIERQADKYASYLLMPEHEMSRVLAKLGISQGVALDIAVHGKTLCDHFTVSAQALEIRLSMLAIQVANSRYPQSAKKFKKSYTSDVERNDWSFKEEVPAEDNWSRV